VDEAEAALERAHDLRPGRVRVHLGLANCARVRDDAAGLERELRAALALDPGHPTVLYNLCFTLVQKGDRAEALDDRLAAYYESLSLLRRLLEQSREGDPNRGTFQQARVSLERKIELSGGRLGEAQD
jgi:cytochrome c-type biogenesis protein CcmH/NrfG